MTKHALLVPLLLLAACGGNGGGERYVKPGADSSSVSREYADCLALARSSARTDSNIDQDIAASRGSDMQRSEASRSIIGRMHETTSARTDAIVASCMSAKGFDPAH